jgi:hypothetical protein
MFVFEGLWTKCDKNGVFEWKPRMLKLDILPFLPFDMPETLSILETNRYIERFEVKGNTYGVIRSFTKHQNVSKAEANNKNVYPLPPPDDKDGTKPAEKTKTVSEPYQDGSEMVSEPYQNTGNRKSEFGDLNSEVGNSETGNSESPHTLANPESDPGEPPFDEDDEGVCFDSQNLDSQNSEKPEKREEAHSEAQTAKNTGYEKPESNARAVPPRSNTGIFETGNPPEKTGPPDSGFSGFGRPRAKINPGQSPPADNAAAGYDRYAALHPGQSPPAADDFEAVRRKWNTPDDGIKLPECRTLSINLNYREREILSRALRDYGREAILDAIDNYFWMKQHPDRVRTDLGYTSLFTFLEKAVESFREVESFDITYVKPEYRSK